jgi:hypothetical protein
MIRAPGLDVGDLSGRAKIRQSPGPLALVLAYRNDEVVFRFQKLYRLSFREASDLFTETRRWLWALARSLSAPDAPRLAIYSHMLLIDEMWHNFVLFTKEYVKFCNDHLSGYIHHSPMTRAEHERLKAAFRKNPRALAKRAERERLEQCNFIYHELGEETLKRWYSDFPKRYTAAFVNSRRRRLGRTGA